MYYRTKPVRVEATQWLKEPPHYGHPFWFSGALDLTHNVLQGKITRVADSLQVVTAKGTAMARDGDWIVYWSTTTRTLQVFSNDNFHRNFEYDEARANRTRIRSWGPDKPKIKHKAS